MIQILVPYDSMPRIPPTSYPLLAAKHEPYQETCLLAKTTEQFPGKKSGERASRQGKKRQSNRSGSRTREETVKWNQMTALKFQTGKTDIPGLPLGREQYK